MNTPKELLAFIASLMHDYEVAEAYPKITLEVCGRVRCLAGTNAFGRIKIYPCSIVYIATDNFKNPSKTAVGKEFLSTLAHEWRHVQQQLLWDTDIPQVRPAAMEKLFSDINNEDREDFQEGYWEDPGEKDAREFADTVVASASQEILDYCSSICSAYAKDNWELFGRLVKEANKGGK